MPAAKRKVVVSLDTYLSILAVVSSFCAIGITFYQAYLQRTQQYASVMPVLESYTNNGREDKTYYFDFVLINNGIGPAFIKDFTYFYKGKAQKSFRNIVDQVAIDKVGRGKEASLDTLPVMKTVYSGLWINRIIPTNQEVKLVSIQSNKLALWMLDAYQRGDINIKIRYASIYGEEWIYNIKAENPELMNVKVKD